MSRRSRIWLVVAVLFSLLNLAGATYAAMQHELLHACTHGVLMLVGALVVRRIVVQRLAAY